MEVAPGLRSRVGVDFGKETVGDKTIWVAELREDVVFDPSLYVMVVWAFMASRRARRGSVEVAMILAASLLSLIAVRVRFPQKQAQPNETGDEDAQRA